MMYRKFTAEQIFDGYSFLENNMVLITDREGAVLDIVKKEEAGDGVEEAKGIISPGFINCHCHLELSHMKGMIPPGTGLINFLIAVVTRRSEQNEEVILEKITAAEKEMDAGGISGVADICNTAHAVPTKQLSKLRWYSLVEVLNFFDKTLPEKLTYYQHLLALHRQKNLAGVLTPHAPYTISSGTFEAINQLTAGQVISIHNQETEDENELFKTGGGDFLRLFSAVGMMHSPFRITKSSSLQTWLLHFTQGQTILLVHNTFIKEEDILFARRHAEEYGLRIIYCLCPNANLYIENQLPPVDLLVKHNCEVVLGTDSYSSNHRLNMAGEVHTLLKHFPFLSLETVLRWATGNAAHVLNWNDLGTFQKGTRPGIVQLETTGENNSLILGTSRRIL